MVERERRCWALSEVAEGKPSRFLIDQCRSADKDALAGQQMEAEPQGTRAASDSHGTWTGTGS